MRTTFEIAKRLTAMGVPTYKGDSTWSKDSVKAYLTNPVYMGKVRWNDRMQIKTMVNGELKITRPRFHSDQYMLYDGKHMKDALIDEETFRAAQKKFYKDRTRSNLKLKNPLAGLVFCKKCGKAMNYQPYPEGREDRIVHKSSSSGCKVKSVIAADMFAAVSYALKVYIEDFEVKIDNAPDTSASDIEQQIEALGKEIRKIEKKKVKLFDSWKDDEITNNEFVERKAIHNSRIEALEKQIEELEFAIPEKLEHEEKLLLLSDAFIAMRDEEIDAAAKNEFLK